MKQLLPDVGDLVNVAIGSDKIAGRVLEAYSSGAQPLVVVQLGTSADLQDRSTIVVPPYSLEPAESTHSGWAESRRYEAEVYAALKRMFDEKTIKRASSLLGVQSDFIVSISDKLILLETKYAKRPINQRILHEIIMHLRTAALRVNSVPFLVMNLDITTPQANLSGIHFVRWTGEQDDELLRAAINGTLINHNR